MLRRQKSLLRKKVVKKEVYTAVWDKTYGADDGDIAQNGKKIWAKTYGQEQADLLNSMTTLADAVHAIARTDDGSMVTVGGSDSYSRATKFYMLKIDKQEKSIAVKVD